MCVMPGHQSFYCFDLQLMSAPLAIRAREIRLTSLMQQRVQQVSLSAR